METIFSEFGLEVGGGLGKQLTITRRKKENTKTRLPCGKQKVFKAILSSDCYQSLHSLLFPALIAWRPNWLIKKKLLELSLANWLFLRKPVKTWQEIQISKGVHQV